MVAAWSVDEVKLTYVCLQGNVIVKGRESAKSLYSADLASMEIEGGGSIDYEPADAQVSCLLYISTECFHSFCRDCKLLCAFVRVWTGRSMLSDVFGCVYVYT